MELTRQDGRNITREHHNENRLLYLARKNGRGRCNTRVIFVMVHIGRKLFIGTYPIICDRYDRCKEFSVNDA